MNAIHKKWQWAILLAVSVPSAWGLDRLDFPAALLLGPMLSGIALGVMGARLQVPRWAFIGAQATIGCLVARAITMTILIEVAKDWAAMLLIVSTTVIAGGIVGWVLYKFRVLPGTTAAWGSSPGAAAAMVAMSEEFGADPRLVAFMQYLRVLVVVLTASIVSRLLLGFDHPVAVAAAVAPKPEWVVPLLPFIETLAIIGIGGFLGRWLKIPAGALLVPMVIGSVLHTTELVDITLPPWLLGIAYAALGWYIGLGFNREVVVYALRAVPKLLLATFMLIGLCGLSAWILTWVLDTDALTAYLATSPGGLDSITIIAVGSQADIPFVLAVQTLRLFVVILTGPQIAKLICRYA